jgi:hypothetical protein
MGEPAGRGPRSWLIDTVKPYVDLGASLAVIIGVPIVLVQIHNGNVEAHTHALESHEQVYAGLDAQYTDFLKLCLNDPKLDCYDVPEDPPPKLNHAEQKRQRILYAVLIPMLEHAYLAYHGPRAEEIKDVTKDQWPGWRTYARNFMKRDAFRDVWSKLRSEFDSGFSTCLDSLSPNASDASSCLPYDSFEYPPARSTASK